MHAARAFITGVIGAVVLIGLMALIRAGGVPVRAAIPVAELFGTQIWFVGFVLYLIFGGIIGIIYAGLFETIKQAGVGPGLLFGGCHGVFAGFIWQGLGFPGRFWFDIGATGVALFWALHFIFGAIMGATYRPVHVQHLQDRYGEIVRG